METEQKIFARIPKNDFNQGGAWDFYWGAFYLKGGRRVEDAQLFLWMNHERLEMGFYLGQHGSQQRQQFLQNCQQFHAALVELLEDSLADDRLWYGSRTSSQPLNWQDWLNDPGKLDIRVAIALPKPEVLSRSADQLIDQILQTYKQLFPLDFFKNKAISQNRGSSAVRTNHEAGILQPSVASIQRPSSTR